MGIHFSYVGLNIYTWKDCISQWSEWGVNWEYLISGFMILVKCWVSIYMKPTCNVYVRRIWWECNGLNCLPPKHIGIHPKSQYLRVWWSFHLEKINCWKSKRCLYIDVCDPVVGHLQNGKLTPHRDVRRNEQNNRMYLTHNIIKFQHICILAHLCYPSNKKDDLITNTS